MVNLVVDPVVRIVPALNPEAVGGTRTTLASISLLRLYFGRRFVPIGVKMKSDAGFGTGTAMIGAI